MIHVSAPGKLFIAGEWAILEVGSPGIVAAVNRRVHCEISEYKQEEAWIYPKITITIDDFNIANKQAKFDGKNLSFFEDLTGEEQQFLRFSKSAIEIAIRYIHEKLGKAKNFNIRTWGDKTYIAIESIDAKGIFDNKKVGFGSSAAATVAIISAILAFHGFDIKKMKQEIYKLSTIAHYYAQGKVGSAFDIAASTYGGVFVYRRFNPNWLLEKSLDEIKDIIESEWSSLYIESIKNPEDLSLIVAWTKESSKTSEMINQMNTFKEKNPTKYNAMIEEIVEVVEQLIEAWKIKNREKILELIRKNQSLLQELTRISGVSIETKDLKKLAEIANQFGAAGKLSGAGGGDCGIALCFDERVSENVKIAWQQNGLYPLDVSIDYDGVKIEK